MRTILKAFIAFTVIFSFGSIGYAQEKPSEIRLDYAYYSPVSIVLKKYGWVEQEFKADNIRIKWVQSQGSNRALEFLRSNTVDFGSSAGLAAVLSRANGNPIKGIYISSRPEWTALVVRKDSPIKSIRDLEGKKVAATKGTDPYLFLLRSLRSVGLKKTDVQHVSLQHADGRAALEQGRVDAWLGLDPLMAASEIEAGSKLIYRNVNFNTYGFLSTTEAFAKKYPTHVKRVLAAYEKARKWVIANPEKTAQLLAEEAKIPLAVAKRQLERTGFDAPIPGTQQVNALKSAGPILLEENLVKKGTNVNQVIDAYIDPSFAKAVVR